MGRVANMQIAPDQGAFLTLLCRLIGAREALELGTFTGYSAICIARGLAPRRAADRLRALRGVRRRSRRAQPRGRRGRRPGRDPDRPGRPTRCATLPEREVFDFAFIDADKPGYPEYYELVLARLRPGGLVVVDNVLADGGVVDADDGDMRPESLDAILELNDRIAADERVDVAMLAIADGLTLARKR